MATITTRDGTPIYYNDWGTGRPVILIHGWPLDGDMWSDQAVFLAQHGLRAITYDRRGFGRSGQPWNGYDYDTLSDDLADLIEGLALEHVTLVGFSMGGGEVARFLGRHGADGIAKAVLISAVTPYLLKDGTNPDGVDQAVFDDMLDGLNEDRPHFLADFGAKFFGNSLLSKKVSTETLQWASQMAMLGSLRATLECVKSFSTTDFRADMAAFTMPTLVIHGSADTTVPIDVSGRRAAAMIPHAQFIEYDGEPHGLQATAKDRLNADLLAFID